MSWTPPHRPAVVPSTDAGARAQVTPIAGAQRKTRSRGVVILACVVGLLFVAAAASNAFLLTRISTVDAQARALSAHVATLERSQREAAQRFDALETKVSGDESRTLDASKVAAIAKPAVFTVVAGNFLGTAFGFYKDDSGTYLVTNYHVVEPATLSTDRTVSVHQDRNTWTGQVTKWNSHFDLALVLVSSDLPILKSASAEGNPPAVGDPVLAYGSPYGLEDTATTGIISALRKQFIQTDAPINHGNSGGPLLDADGNVLGITSYGVAGGGSGLGLAIDVGEVCQVLLSADIC